LQSAPLTRHFAQIIALLPALQTVRGSVSLALFLERGGVLDGVQAQPSLEGIQERAAD